MSQPRLAYNIPLPPDLNLAIMVMLSFHLGSRNAISRTRLRGILVSTLLVDVDANAVLSSARGRVSYYPSESRQLRHYVCRMSVTFC